MTKPYLSVVVVTRNDNYGVGLFAKLQTFHGMLVELCTEARLDTEILLVDWNPPPENPGIAEVASSSFIGSEQVTTRVVTVPASVHSGLPLGSRRPLFEYVGKNVGVRRASGEFILVTNPDTVFSSRLIDKLKHKSLREDAFYRVDRADVASPVPQNLPAREIEEYCRRNVLRVHGHWIGDRQHNRSIHQWLLHAPAILRRVLGSIVQYRRLVPLHLGAPGDFMLMHRRYWHELRGFAELELFSDRSYHLDSLGVIQATFHGLRQIVFDEALYHQEHEHPEQEKPWTPSVRFVYDAMRSLRSPWYNSADWGLGDLTLPDQIVPTRGDREAVELHI